MIYMGDIELRFHDLDNRLKDIMDALQGRVGGSRIAQLRKPIIQNDHQIFRVVIEKRLPPGQSHGLGHLILKKYKP